MFRRKASPESNSSVQVNEPEPDVSSPTVKGRPTPSRKEAEAARKQRVKPALTRREQLKRDRERMREQRSQTRRAMATGDERQFMKRDQGPVRKFVRDYVDSRRTVGEFFLPLIIVVLIASLAGGPAVQSFVTLIWLVTMLLLIVDMTFLARRVKREVRKRFPDESVKGLSFYAVARATQIRKLRMPKPTVKPGAVV